VPKKEQEGALERREAEVVNVEPKRIEPWRANEVLSLANILRRSVAEVVRGWRLRRRGERGKP